MGQAKHSTTPPWLGKECRSHPAGLTPAVQVGQEGG